MSHSSLGRDLEKYPKILVLAGRAFHRPRSSPIEPSARIRRKLATETVNSTLRGSGEPAGGSVTRRKAFSSCSGTEDLPVSRGGVGVRAAAADPPEEALHDLVLLDCAWRGRRRGQELGACPRGARRRSRRARAARRKLES